MRRYGGRVARPPKVAPAPPHTARAAPARDPAECHFCYLGGGAQTNGTNALVCPIFSGAGLKLVEIPPEIDFDSLATSKSLCFKVPTNRRARARAPLRSAATQIVGCRFTRTL